jgi:hypothetical protein
MYSGQLIDQLLQTVERAEEHARLEAVTASHKVAVDMSTTFIYDFRPQPQAALLGVA